MNAVAEPLPRLAKYDVIEEIGHGGMATVYRAVDTRLGREVAVKIIHRHLRESVEVGRRFIDEARAVAKLRHRGIVEVFDVSDDDSQYRYLVAELVRGRSLRKWLTEHRVIPTEAAVCIALEVAEALSHAHTNGIIHRDVKPENVLIGRGPVQSGVADRAQPIEVKITDFGIAKLLDQQGVTSTGQVLGSPAYMAPEQIECGDIDARSDIFSLGVLLYECTVGRLPFDGKNPAQVLRRVLDGRFVPADHENPTVGSKWAGVMAKMLAHQIERRYTDMNEVVSVLRAGLSESGVNDARAEVTRYFDDPDAYEESEKKRLVPVLLALGEKAQKKGDVMTAAGCYNRGLALAPADPALLAHVARLSRSRSRRELVVRGAMATTLIVTVAFLSWASVRFLRVQPLPSVDSVLAPLNSLHTPVPAPTGTATPSATVANTSTSVVPSTTSPSIVPQPTVSSGGAVSPPKTRRVVINVIPKSALVSLDGGPPEPVGFGLVRELPVSNEKHLIEAFVKNDSCCEKGGTSFVVEADVTGRDQVVSMKLPFRDARLVSDGPPGTTISCPDFKIVGSARGAYSVPMSVLDDAHPCTLSEGGKTLSTQSVTLFAGKTSTIVWPSSSIPGHHPLRFAHRELPVRCHRSTCVVIADNKWARVG